MVLMRFHFASFAALAFSFVVAGAGAGCKEQSLFDEGKDDPDGPGPVGDSCPADCLGDAARDFNDSDGAAGERWRYLEDRRDRSWTALTAADGVAVGADPALAITTCQSRPTAPACDELPGALLLSSSGAATASDPAIEFKVASKGTLQLGVRAFVATTDPAQQIVVYRNSREDLLFTGAATPGTLFEQSIAVDALSGDRLLVALVPASGGATDVGLDLFVSDTGLASRCQVALTFEQVSGTAVNAQCGGAFTNYEDVTGTPEIPPVLGSAPYPELGQSAVIAPNTYYKGVDALDKAGDTTLQYWLRFNAFYSSYDAWPVSDMDLNGDRGGLGNAIYERADIRIDTTIGSPANTYIGSNAPFNFVGQWVFVRVVHAGGKVSTCLNGKRISVFDLEAGKLKTTFPLYLGKNVLWTPQVAAFDGSLDDLRVLSTALPCE